MAIPLTLWHSNFVKSFLSLISKQWNFQYFEKMFISRDIAFSVINFRVCIMYIFNHREKKFTFLRNIYFSIYRLLRAFLPCLNVCIFSIVATPFNLHLRNFGITSFMWLSKKGFLKFLKKKFLAELLHFFFQIVSPVSYRT